jgi:sarcosine oxidase, subunit delta
MIILDCPWCGPRNVSEFAHIGEVTPRPQPAAASPQAWRTYLYVRDNPSGWTIENWFHRAGCRRYFRAERHTLTNEVRQTARPRRVSPTAPGEEPS